MLRVFKQGAKTIKFKILKNVSSDLLQLKKIQENLEKNHKIKKKHDGKFLNKRKNYFYADEIGR